MKLGLLTGYSGRTVRLPLDGIKHAEKLGYDSVWTSEAYGSDAVSPAAWILANTSKIKVGTAIMQMPARTPTMAAMTAMTLAQLSGNRFIIGVGASGPQVIEGWHGVAYGRPVTRLKEYVQIMRRVFAREDALSFDGKEYQIPYKGPGATGLGKPLKSILHCETPIPIYAATLTPAGVQAAAEVADGFFPVWMDPDQYKVFQEPIEKGFKAAGGGKTLAQFDIAPFVAVNIGDDVKACMAPLREHMALYIGGMGAQGQELLHRLRDPARLRRCRPAGAGPLPRRQEGGGCRRRARGAGRCLPPGRSARPHPRPAAALDGGKQEGPRRHHADPPASARGARAGGQSRSVARASGDDTMIKRIPGSIPTRSKTVIHNGLVYTVTTAPTKSAPLYGQTKEALAIIDRSLADAGSDKSRILTATVFITDMSKKEEMNRAWDEWVDKANPPRRACIGAVLEGQDLVEILVTAAQ